MKYAYGLGLVVVALFAACSSTSSIQSVPDTSQSDVPIMADATDVTFVEVVEDVGAELAADFAGLADVHEFVPECEPDSGCFGEPCFDGSDCLSGLCVEHMGNLVCSMQCVEECPAGWSCKETGAGGPDVNWVCVSDFRMLCRPCFSDQDCTSSTGHEGVCLEYGPEGSFCGGTCSEELPCPEGYGCIDQGQCMADSGICSCSETAIELGLATSCWRSNDVGTCEGVRVCTEDGLTECDAVEAAVEECNGLDDDCNGLVDDDPTTDSGQACDDGNPCTEDNCLGPDGCEFSPLDGTNCDDVDACTLTDHCDEGICTGTPVSCDDANVCTDDSCDGMDGCTFVDNQVPCDDGNPCTIGDQCGEGECTGIPVSCDCQTDADCQQYEDGDLCNGTLYCDKSGVEYSCAVDQDSVPVCPGPPPGPDSHCLIAHCEPDSGVCGFAPSAEGFACEDGDACTFGETCTEGSCDGGNQLNCDDGNQCTADSCWPDAGCQHEETSGSCDDGNLCTTGDFCAEGQCVSTTLQNCNDDNLCTTDSCNPASGCFHDFNAAPCDDSDQCTVNDYCEHGECLPGVLLDCDDSNMCTADSCNPLVGCLHTNTGVACDDQDPCTSGDKCSGGVCVGIEAKDCNDGNPCTDDVCVPMAGCSHNNNLAPCNDENVCTVDDHCVLGECIPGQLQVCDDGNVCTDDSCDEQEGCKFAPNTDPCDDGNSCTTGDVCAAGKCKGDGSLECDDSNPCTKDLCLPGGGCQHEEIEGACSDGDPCTVNDSCLAGACIPGTTLNCDDGNVCTDDYCDDTGTCQHSANEESCDDGNPCTIGDHCLGGSCKVTGPLDCDDGNPCTTDWCDPVSGCVNQDNQLPCTDGDVCTLADVCQDGACVGGAEMVCDDFNLCTENFCHPDSGCQFVPNEAPCSDGNKCTQDDVCGGGWCQPGTALDCDDEDLCTADFCSPLEGCWYTHNVNPCDDGDACTADDACLEGVCTGGPPVLCDDTNICTDDSCQPDSGCVFSHNAAACDDDDLCTDGDQCANGACVPGPALDCNDDNSCTEDSCIPQGGCSNLVLPDDTVCADDGNSCTTDKCLAGECVHSGEGWSVYQGHCYKWFAETKSWGAARAQCQAFGGDLASVADASENSFVHSLADNSTASWTGLTDAASEGQWKWSDGTPTSYTNWNGGEPNNSGNEDCMHLYKYSGQSSDKRWNDANCGSGYPYTCEK